MPLPDLCALDWRDALTESFSTLIGPMGFAYDPPSEEEPAGKERWYARLTVDTQHLNLGGVCHGGVLMTLADNAMGSAAYMAGGRKPCATIELTSQFIAGVHTGEILIAEAQITRRTPEIAFLTGTVWATARTNGPDRIAMTASGIWKYLTKYKS
ncbi:MAG: PaaI family thioesterase [Pseudomonadota bacterium]